GETMRRVGSGMARIARRIGNDGPGGGVRPVWRRNRRELVNSLPTAIASFGGRRYRAAALHLCAARVVLGGALSTRRRPFPIGPNAVMAGCASSPGPPPPAPPA